MCGTQQFAKVTQLIRDRTLSVSVCWVGDFSSGASGNESACQCRRCKRLRFNPWVRKIPASGKWQTIPVFLPGKSHGQTSLAGYSPWDHKGSDTTELCWMHCCANLKALVFNDAIMEMRKNQTAGSKRKRSFGNQLWTRSGSQRWVWLWNSVEGLIRVWCMNLFIKHFVWLSLMTFSKASYPKWD